MIATSIFVQTGAPQGRQERARVFGAEVATRVVPVMVAERPGIVFHVRRALGFALRQLARGLYVSPVLVVADLALRFWSAPAGDLVVVVFSSLVVCFFVALNLYVLASFVWWIQSRRPRNSDHDWKPFTRRTPRAALGVRVSGRIERLGSEGDGVVLRDFWAGGARPWRLTETAVFLVRPDDRAAEPVVVACTTAPEIEGHGEPSAAAALLGLVSAEARALALHAKGAVDEGVLLTLSEGDRVEVTAVRAQPVENLDRIPLPGGETLIGDPGGDPYRDQPAASPRSGFLLMDDEKAPVSIRRLV